MLERAKTISSSIDTKKYIEYNEKGEYRLFYMKERELEMEKAKTLQQAINVFDVRPLSDHEKISEFYVDTSEARGEDAAAKLMYLLDKSDRQHKKFLFMGHHGCGKSTELYRVADKLRDRFLIIHYSIGQYVDYIGVSYIDVLFSILANILDVAQAHDIDIDRSVVESIYNYWKDERILNFSDEERLQDEEKLSVGISLVGILATKVKLLLQTSSEVKEKTTRHLDPTIPELISKINVFLDDFCIKAKKQGKMPLLMIDDLDKLGLTQAEDVFIDHSRYITSLNIDIVYTFPIYLYYSPDFQLIAYDFDECILLSMIKVKQSNGLQFDKGIDTIREIICRRAEESIFEEGTIKYVTEKSGGCIRTAFRLLRSAALNAELDYRKNYPELDDAARIIRMNDVLLAYRSYKSEMERMIRKDQIELLKEIYANKRPIIDKDNVLVMDLLMTLAVIEYNGERWCDLNPAIYDFLVEKNEIKPDEKRNGD